MFLSDLLNFLDGRDLAYPNLDLCSLRMVFLEANEGANTIPFMFLPLLGF